MKQFVLTLILGLGILCPIVNAQKVRVEGVVKDSLNKPLELANVLALNPETNSIESYAITDESGRFALALPINKTFTLKVSYLGYKTKEEQLIIGDSKEKIVKEIVLFRDRNVLEGVEVVQELPISVKGDTIVYKADAFTDGKEKKLQNVLEKLPGFEVSKDGEIKVQGKKVDKVLVEGKKFFDGDSKLATKNIPADAVDKIEVLQDFNEVAPTRGLGNEQRLALNVKLKDGKKNIWFGDVEASGGHDERYLAHANLFYYSPKKSLNIIGDANNIGAQAFTVRDYIRFNGGFGSLANRSGSTFRVSSDDLGFALGQDNRANDVISNLGAFNFNLNPNKKWNFSGFLIGSDNDTDYNSLTLRTYLLNDDSNNLELLESAVNRESRSGLLKFSGKYTPNDNLDISYNAFLKRSDLRQANNRLSDFSGVTNTILSEREQSPFSIEQSFNAFYAKDAKNIFSFQAEHSYKEQDPFFDLFTSEIPFAGGLPLNSDLNFNVLQNTNIITNKLDASLNYYYVINKKNHINFTAGTSLNHQKLVSDIRQRDTGSGVENNLGDGFNNNATYDFTDYYFGIRYKVKFGSLVVSPGATLHFYSTEDNQFSTENGFDKTLLLPQLYAKYNIKKTESLTLNYAVNAEFTDINNLVFGTTITNYNTLFQGNRDLENQLFHNFTLRYSNFNSFNFTNLYGTLTYRKTIDGINNTVIFNGINQVLSPINASDVNDVLSGNVTYEKRFPWVKINTSANLSFSRINNEINGIENTNESFTQNYKLSLESNFKESPNFEIGFETTINNYEGNQTDSRFTTNAPFVNVEAYFLKSFLFTADYVYTDFINRTNSTNNTYDILNANLIYQKEGSSWEFKVSGTNLLNTLTINRDSFNDFLISNNQFFIQPRYVVLGVKYNL